LSEPAAYWLRAAAFVVDFIVVWSPVFITGAAGPGGGVVGLPLTLVLGLVYYTVFRERTLGKRLFRVRVQDAATGRPVDYFRSFKRFLIGAALWSLLVPGVIDILYPLWSEAGQTLHDQFVGSAVVSGAPRGAVRPFRASALRRRRLLGVGIGIVLSLVSTWLGFAQSWAREFTAIALPICGYLAYQFVLVWTRRDVRLESDMPNRAR
jgi:uncharacterized RDD family membrane protein YckC